MDKFKQGNGVFMAVFGMSDGSSGIWFYVQMR